MGNRTLCSDHPSDPDAAEMQMAKNTPWLLSEGDLEAYLEAKGVDTSQLGKGTAKSLTHLFFELRSEASFLEPQKETNGPQVIRVVEPVFIRLCWHSHVLVQQQQQLTDGRLRTRKMLLAEKKEPRDGGGLFATIVRAISEELGIDPNELRREGVLVYRTDAYHYELEQIDSPSYPGLPSMYRTHHVMVDIPNGSLELFSKCGLPDCRNFVTLESTELGTQTNYWAWYETAEALKHRVVKFPPQHLSPTICAEGLASEGAAVPDWKRLSLEEVGNLDQLAALLEQAGVDPQRFGQGKAKPLKSLLKEVEKGDCWLEWNESQRALRRIAEPVFIQFRWGDRVLVEVEQTFADGRKRQRNMLLAEKKSPEDASVSATCLRGLQEELNIPEELTPLGDYVRFVQQAYCCVAENLESSSYPGLACLYITHYCTVELLEAGQSAFEDFGFLEVEFETSEEDKLNTWRWTLTEKARKDKVKGFPELKDVKDNDKDKEETDTQFDPLRAVPLDAGGLRVLLEVGGVNVSAWGEYTLASLECLSRELETGAARLEKHRDTGTIRRVIPSHLVQLNVEVGKRTSVRMDDGGRKSNVRFADPDGEGLEARTEPAAFGVEKAQGLVKYRADLDCFEVACSDVTSYPGLPCCHQTQLVQFEHKSSSRSHQQSHTHRSSGSAAGGAATDSAGFASETADTRRRGSLQDFGVYPKLLDDVFTSQSGTGEESSSRLTLPFDVRTSSKGSKSRWSRRQVSVLVQEADMGSPMSAAGGALSLPTSCSTPTSMSLEPLAVTPKRKTLYRQLRRLQKDLRFRMVANESQQEPTPPADHAVACACEIQLIRNINPLNATYHCRFAVYLEWVDPKAVGLPTGEVEKELAKELSVPEIALQNTLGTSLEIHSPPEVVNSETGHVGCKVLYQALMQMELNMRLFPFDEQRLVMQLGLRARRDRSRAIFCQYCNVDKQIRMDEWRLTSSFQNADRPDGRARVQFGVVISRAYWYYLVNVLGTLVGIASMSLVGYLLKRDPPFDRLRFGVAVLFAQTTFRLSIENKLPKVSYATAFDKYAMFCQLLVLAILVGNAVTSLDRPFTRSLDPVFAVIAAAVWVFGNVIFAVVLRKARKQQNAALLEISDDTSADATDNALQELERLKEDFHFRGKGRLSVLPGESCPFVRAVSVSTRIWLLHDIDPVSATFECKFTLYLEWLEEAAIGLPENEPLSEDQLKQLDPPAVDIHNKVELTKEASHAHIVNSRQGQIMLCTSYHARLQIHLNLRRFPFDSQRLPINLMLPNQKDEDRAFIYRGCNLAHTACTLDEWLIDRLEPSTDCTQGVAQATLTVCISRRSKYYVLSVLCVLLGISTLMFTVFVIDVNADNKGFSDQGKILAPLLMTLLAFKLLISGGKIPKAAYATIFDRIMLACEALFFLTIVLCSITFIMALNPETKARADSFRTHAGLVLFTAWLLHGSQIAVEVRCGRDQHHDPEPQQQLTTKVTSLFEQQRQSLVSQPESSPQPSSKAVLMKIDIKQVHSINAASGTVICAFVVSLAWLSKAAEELSDNESLGPDKLREMRMPKLRVQNALSANQTVLGGCVVSSKTGHVACQIQVRATVQLRLQLDDFPFDHQSLAVVLSLTESCDLERCIILDGCHDRNAAKICEWALMGTFAAAGRNDGFSQAIFGIKIRRHSHIYVTSLKSATMWSLFVFTMYTIDFQDFHDRGKVLVSVLLVSIVAKLAVSSKLPRIARLTAYDRVALNTLALLFGIGSSAAFWCLLSKLEMFELETLAQLDRASGVLLFFTWLLINTQVAYSTRKVLCRSNDTAPIEVPSDLWAESSDQDSGPTKVLPADVSRELETLRFASLPFSTLGEHLPTPRKEELALTADQLAISVGLKLWMICNVDGSTGTFECKFHVFLEWYAPAAIGTPTGSRISSQGEKTSKLTVKDLKRPKLVVKEALAVLLEDYSDVEVQDGITGLVGCRVQWHVKVFQPFSLGCFPFDCQRLGVTLELQNCTEHRLSMGFCDSDDQTKYLDGWRLSGISMLQEENQERSLSTIMLVSRESGFYVRHVMAIFFFLTTLLFSFYLMRPDQLVMRMVDTLKIVLTQTTFRFSVEHRLPKIPYRTPFDTYVLANQGLCCLVVVSFISSAMAHRNPRHSCLVKESERMVLLVLSSLWLLWNMATALQARRLRRRELSRWRPEKGNALRASAVGGPRGEDSDSLGGTASATSGGGGGVGSYSLGDGVRPWETLEKTERQDITPQVISVAFRIWLVRNVDLVTATFECKFRVFLEWLDEEAVGLPKGKKAKLAVPAITITNSVSSQVLDQSSAPEVVNSDTGHLAVQILYRATLRMDQEVRDFPFDCQWLAITLSLRDEGAERSRSFMFQYCEVDGTLQLDEWTVFPTPAFNTLTKHDAPSIQDTVMCGVLIRRCARYYVVNIMFMLGLISSLVFAIYTIAMIDFWARAEVFLGIFPLTVVFKMSAQGKLPKVGYSTKFDQYAASCQILFLAIVLGSMFASISVNLPIWVATCDQPDYDMDLVTLVSKVENYVAAGLLVLWFVWNVYFSLKAWQASRLHPLMALRRTNPKIQLQDDEQLRRANALPNVNGLAPRLSLRASQEKTMDPDSLEI